MVRIVCLVPVLWAVLQASAQDEESSHCGDMQCGPGQQCLELYNPDTDMTMYLCDDTPGMAVCTPMCDDNANCVPTDMKAADGTVVGKCEGLPPPVVCMPDCAPDQVCDIADPMQQVPPGATNIPGRCRAPAKEGDCTLPCPEMQVCKITAQGPACVSPPTTPKCSPSCSDAQVCDFGADGVPTCLRKPPACTPECDEGYSCLPPVVSLTGPTATPIPDSLWVGRCVLECPTPCVGTAVCVMRGDGTKECEDAALQPDPVKALEGAHGVDVVKKMKEAMVVTAVPDDGTNTGTGTGTGTGTAGTTTDGNGGDDGVVDAGLGGVAPSVLAAPNEETKPGSGSIAPGDGMVTENDLKYPIEGATAKEGEDAKKGGTGADGSGSDLVGKGGDANGEIGLSGLGPPSDDVLPPKTDADDDGKGKSGEQKGMEGEQIGAATLTPRGATDAVPATPATTATKKGGSSGLFDDPMMIAMVAGGVLAAVAVVAIVAYTVVSKSRRQRALLDTYSYAEEPFL